MRSHQKDRFHVNIVMGGKMKNVATLLVVSSLFGCASDLKVKADPNKATPPVVSIKFQRSGVGTGASVDPEFIAADSVNFDAGNPNAGITILCVGEDPGGLSSLQLTFTGGHSDTCTVEGQVKADVNGYTIEGVPQTQSQKLSQDNTLSKLTFIASANNGGFFCSTKTNPPKQGVPIGAQLTARCAAANWSKNPQTQSAIADLKINLTGTW